MIQKRVLSLMFNIFNNVAPSYMCDIDRFFNILIVNIIMFYYFIYF